MAEAFLSLNARDRRDILETVAARSGRSAGILEKDIWICWVLQTLFSIPHSHPMAFKGGTSLSKVYGESLTGFRKISTSPSTTGLSAMLSIPSLRASAGPKSSASATGSDPA